MPNQQSSPHILFLHLMLSLAYLLTRFCFGSERAITFLAMFIYRIYMAYVITRPDSHKMVLH